MTTPKIISRADAKAQGLKRYFTGKPCPQGHVVERFIVNSTCVKCIRARCHKWAQEHPEEHRARSRKWSQEHPEENRERSRKWKLENSEKCRATAQRYASANRDKMNAKNARRRALRLKQTPKWCMPGSEAYDFIGEIYSDALHFSEVFGIEFQVEHKCPLAHGGTHEPGNLTIIPAKLNMEKGAKLDYEFPPNVFHKVTWRSWSRKRGR